MKFQFYFPATDFLFFANVFYYFVTCFDSGFVFSLSVTVAFLFHVNQEPDLAPTTFYAIVCSTKQPQLTSQSARMVLNFLCRHISLKYTILYRRVALDKRSIFERWGLVLLVFIKLQKLLFLGFINRINKTGEKIFIMWMNNEINK